MDPVAPTRRRSVGLLLALMLTTELLSVGASPALASPLAYWTPQRIALATQSAADASPAKPAAGWRAIATSQGQQFSSGGLVERATGRAFFTIRGVPSSCSAVVVRDSRRDISLVMTAAHCAYRLSASQTLGTSDDIGARRFTRNWMFIPSYDAAPTRRCARTRYGCWAATGLVLSRSFAQAPCFCTDAAAFDFALAVVGRGGKYGRQLDATVGALPISFSDATQAGALDIFGYPVLKPYSGRRLIRCTGEADLDTRAGTAVTAGVECDMTKGASGGPWLANFDPHTGTGTVIGLNSYGWFADDATKRNYGPVFGAQTRRVYDVANSGVSGNTLVDN